MKRALVLFLLSLVVLACSKTADTPPPTPTASFSFTLATNGEVAFLNNSQNATAYSWDFGDDTAKVTDASPRHVYAVNGKYNVVLTATGAGGSATSTQVVTVSNAPDPKPTVDFTATETAGVVSFLSTTNYTTSVSWDFGDGTAKSAESNPKHTYTKNQIYTVVLTAMGKGGTTSVSKSVEVKAVPDPRDKFVGIWTGNYRVTSNKKNSTFVAEGTRRLTFSKSMFNQTLLFTASGPPAHSNSWETSVIVNNTLTWDVMENPYGRTKGNAILSEDSKTLTVTEDAIFDNEILTYISVLTKI